MRAAKAFVFSALCEMESLVTSWTVAKHIRPAARLDERERARKELDGLGPEEASRRRVPVVHSWDEELCRPDGC